MLKRVLTHVRHPAKRRAVLSALVLLAWTGAAPSGFAGPEERSPIEPPAKLSGPIEQEILKRTQRTQEATALIQEGDKAMAEKDFAQAVEKFRQAVDLLPQAPMVQRHREAALGRFADASVAQARKLGKDGKFDEANHLLDTVLDANYLPTHSGAVELKRQLQDPDRFNPAMTPAHATEVETVRRLFQLAEGQVNLGDFNAAKAAYNQILQTDPHNVAARRGLEKCERLIDDYLLAARDHTRQKAMADVDRNWETMVPATSFGPKLPDAPLTAEGGEGRAAVLRDVVFPKVGFEDASLDDVVQYLNAKTREVSGGKSNVNFVLRLGDTTADKLPRVTLDLREIPLEQLLNYIAEQTGTKWKRTGSVVVISTKALASEKLEVRSYNVPPGFLSSAPMGEEAAGGDDPFAAGGAGEDAASGLKVRKVNAREFLERSGVPFPQGATADFERSSGRLIVRNTEANLDLVQTLVDQLKQKSPRQVEVRMTILQASENRLKELGFDWLMGYFNVGGGRMFGSGGTYGNTGRSTVPSLDYPLFAPAGTPSAFGVLQEPIGTFPMTAGNRSSGDLKTHTSIDDLLTKDRYLGEPTRRSPGMFALIGAFTDPQFQVVIRALNQKKGIDVSSSNTVVVKSGQIAKAASVREILYPTDYDPPQIPQTFQGTPGAAAPVTPATPTSFESRATGSLLEVEATISEDGSQVDLTLAPEFVTFDGFINYGTPINSYSAGERIILTRNAILRPVFSTMRMPQTAVTVYDGNTLVIGGLQEMRESAIEDKIPILGDLPLVGRLFRSSVKESSRKAILFFVQVKVIDPAGMAIREMAQRETAPQDNP